MTSVSIEKRSPGQLPGNWVPDVTKYGFAPKPKPVPIIDPDPRHTTCKLTNCADNITCQWCIHEPRRFASLTISLIYGGTEKVRDHRNMCGPCAELWLYYWPALNFDALAPVGPGYRIPEEY